MNGPTLASAVSGIISLVSAALPVLGGVALLIFFWGVIKYIWAAGDSHSKASGREIIVWGLVALFVIFSVWGILSMACLSFLGDSTCNTVSPGAINNSGGAGGNLTPLN